MTQDGPLDRLRRFGEQHGTKRAHVLHIKDGEVWYTETAPGVLAITWFLPSSR